MEGRFQLCYIMVVPSYEKVGQCYADGFFGRCYGRSFCCTSKFIFILAL